MARALAGVAAAALVVATAAPASAVQAFDGDFETPVVAPGRLVTYSTGQHAGPWTVVGGTVDQLGAGYWQAARGVQSIDLNGVTSGAIEQTFSSPPLAVHRVSFSLAGNPGDAPSVKTGQLLVNGVVMRDFSFDTTGRSRTDMGYVRLHTVFFSTSTSITLRFASTSPSNAWGPVVDDVEVESCPLALCSA
ncbi:choice-of-anchor C family protein [Umezawaea beigongshangensis]|uniref:choice-of-anchor C family protein n=1 Tax=Umezawaea beigongshangensis TaxID=2780383 RepID=UPI0018F16C50|nr:choice-of-anchor C family protein [Umezawaea beigongshangensis]